MYQWSDKVIRKAVRLWDVRDNNILPHNVFLLVTPKVVVSIIFIFFHKNLSWLSRPLVANSDGSHIQHVKIQPCYSISDKNVSSYCQFIFEISLAWK